MYPFKVLTWNVGSDEDYKNMLQKASREGLEDTDIADERNRIAKLAFETFLQTNQVDIICLQNIGSNLDRVKSWLGNEYEIQSDVKDTAVAYRCRFQFKSCTIGDKHRVYHYTNVTLQDYLTNKIINVASLHFKFEFENQEDVTSKSTIVLRDVDDLAQRSSDTAIIGLHAGTQSFKRKFSTLLQNINKLLERNRFSAMVLETLDPIYTRGVHSISVELPPLSTQDLSPHMPNIQQLEFDTTQISEESAAAAAAGPIIDEDSEDEEEVPIVDGKKETSPETSKLQSSNSPAEGNKTTTTGSKVLRTPDSVITIKSCMITMAAAVGAVALVIPFYAGLYNPK